MGGITLKFTDEELKTITPIKGTITINFETACGIKPILENNCENIVRGVINSSLTDNFFEFTFDKDTFIKIQEGKLWEPK